MLFTRYTCAQCNENDSGDGIFNAERTAKMWCNISDDSGYKADRNNRYHKTQVATINIW